MIIKRGNVVCHAGAMQWGSGKVVEVAPHRATIQFSDGIIRKIAASHYTVLQPADPNTYLSPVDCPPVPKVRAKREKKVKEPAA